MAKKQVKIKASIPLMNMKPYSKGKDVKKMVTAEEMEQMRRDRLKSWVTFYRFNPSYFVEHYMGVKLYPYQRFWITLMSHATKFIAVASRASAKSWLIAVYSIARCILYPGTTVVLASSTKQQAGLIISEKCTMLRNAHPNIARETSKIVGNQNVWEMVFHNGSKITVVVSGEGGRGNRSNVTVLEERRLIPTEVIDSIIRPFLISRQPPYMNEPEYSGIQELREEPIEVTITSAHYKSADWYPELKKALRKIVAGDPDTKALFLDYQILLRHGIKTRKQMISEQEDIDPITFLMEYGNIPYGSSSTSFYKMGLFERKVKKSWRPITDEMYIVNAKKNPYDILKRPEEMRIVSVDVAMRAGTTSDNTIISCGRLLPTKKGWALEVSYIESHHGVHTSVQALRIKQIFNEFEADVLVLDILNAGISLYDALSSVTKDEVRGPEYEAMSVMNTEWISDKLYEELTNRTAGREANGCIFPIAATAGLNSLIAVKFKERLRQGLVSFLVDDNIEEEFLIESKNKDILDQTDSGIRAYLLQAHLQTTLFINESIALEMVMQNGLVKLEKPEGGRQDRYTSVSYLNYYVSLMDIDLLKERSGETDEQAFLDVARFF